MGVELRPLGIKCNIQCQYCYQNPQRDAGNVAQEYDIEKMKAAIEATGHSFILFGGEALLVPEDDLEALWAWGYERFGHNGVQTNGTLINANHIALFKKYNVHVGISMDGPGPLNDIRWAGSVEKTRASTAKTEAAIERLCEENVPVNVIVTLHRGNSTADKLPTMHEWIRKLDRLGVKALRLHILEVDTPIIRAKYTLSTEENIEAFLSFAELEEELCQLRLDVFEDMRRLLMGFDKQSTCVWNACDPYTTRAVQGIEGFGQTSNCGRTNKDGVDFTKASQEGFERYIALYHTPQEHLGCRGCRFFLMCKGQCPGTAVNGDWRNRTEHCEVWMRLYERLEERLQSEGKLPLSMSGLRTALEHKLLQLWANGQNMPVADCMAMLQRDPVFAEQLHEFYGANGIKHKFRAGYGITHVDHIYGRELSPQRAPRPQGEPAMAADA
jgi:uncharacterized protein